MEAKDSINISILGTGKLARSLVQGLIERSKVSPANLRLTVRSQESKKQLEVDFPGAFVMLDNAEAVKGAQIVLVGVKPYDLKFVLKEVSEHLEPGCLVLSLAAAMELEEFSKSLSDRMDLRIGRLMANTACATGSGLMAIDLPLHEKITSDEKALLDGLGLVNFVDEKDFDAFTVMAASAPAFMLDWSKALNRSAVDLGLSTVVAQKIVLGLLSGAHAQLSKDFDPEKLMKQIATPGGMTAEGLSVLEDKKLGEIVNQAARASFVKAQAWKS